MTTDYTLDRAEALAAARQLADDGRIDEALNALDGLIAACPVCDDAYYLRGNVFRKRADWKAAIENYLKAMELNPAGPAREAYRMAMDILEYSRRDPV